MGSIYNHYCKAKPLAFYALNLTYFEMERHTHPRCELMYVESGSCTVHVQSSTYLLEERQFIFLDADVEHELHISKEQRCAILNLEFSCTMDDGIDISPLWEKSILWKHLLSKKAPYFIGVDSYQLGYGLKDLISELNRSGVQNQYLLELQFLRLLLELARCVEDPPLKSGIVYVRKAEQYIRDHYASEISVADVVHSVQISYSYLQTLFSQYHHCGIQTYINRLRIEKAVFLLENSSMNAMDIGFFVGFNSRQHFSYTFAKQMGVTPGQYKKLHRKKISVISKKEQSFSQNQLDML